ncbi:MAG: DUF255 domain-containing protein, partial [Spirochaetia bacterium]|nr:DUF255 domain-containing protein [Spirochaetia bacterium]
MLNNEKRGKNINFSRNNLDKALSPYLRQHSDNPVFWQEWSSDVLAYAKEEGKILFVSAGYSTCHWCHVMASEAFSDQMCADYLNRYFVSIKIDREERPDIDRYLMSYLTASTGSGGWPLNAFLSPDLKPFFAMTYAPLDSRYNMPGFYQILRQVKDFYDNNSSMLSEFTPVYNIQGKEGKGAAQIDKALLAQADFNPDAKEGFEGAGGFGTNQKFPPHSSMLYLLYRIAGFKSADSSSTQGSTDSSTEKDESAINNSIIKLVRKTLDSMCLKGLHDHLQGGFFRYCVDRSWTIPHFEKMLYDQAMLLWVFSLASRIFKEPLYKDCAEGIFRCLSETFLDNGLFCAAYDADTDHREGDTYLWETAELEKILSKEEFDAISRVYSLPERGNFEGKIHLIKKDGYTDILSADGKSSALLKNLLSAEEKLLTARKERLQPFCDCKKITSWNSFAGIALLQMHRHLGNNDALNMALDMRSELVNSHITKTGTVL